jgi:hypothetical protein
MPLRDANVLLVLESWIHADDIAGESNQPLADAFTRVSRMNGGYYVADFAVLPVSVEF